MDTLALLQKQKLAPETLEHKGGALFYATFPAAQYDALRRCQQRLYKASLDGNAVDFWIRCYGLRVQRNTAYMWFKVAENEQLP